MERQIRASRSAWILLLALCLIGSSARAAFAQAESSPASRSLKSPALALGLSLMLPGAGQVYNGQWGKAGLMFGGEALALGLLVSSSAECGLDSSESGDCGRLIAGAIVGIGFALWSWIDAPLSAVSINRGIRSLDLSVELGLRLLAADGNRPFHYEGSRGRGLIGDRLSLGLVRLAF